MKILLTGLGKVTMSGVLTCDDLRNKSGGHQAKLEVPAEVAAAEICPGVLETLVGSHLLPAR